MATLDWVHRRRLRVFLRLRFFTYFLRSLDFVIFNIISLLTTFGKQLGILFRKVVLCFIKIHD